VEEEEADQQIQKDGCGPLPTETLSRKPVVLHLFDEPMMPTPTLCVDNIPTFSGPITNPTEIKTVR
jgi:hypothetical protein